MEISSPFGRFFMTQTTIFLTVYSLAKYTHVRNHTLGIVIRQPGSKVTNLLMHIGLRYIAVLSKGRTGTQLSTRAIVAGAHLRRAAAMRCNFTISALFGFALSPI